jgi:uncharacterized protein YkwD
MKNVLIIILLQIGNLYVEAQSIWNETYYNKYTYQTITNFASINDTIVPEKLDYKLLNAAIFFETNRQRALYGLKPLKHDSRLENCAQGHSQDMALFEFYSHTSVIPGKRELSDRAKKAGIPDEYIGENIHDFHIMKMNKEYYYPPSQAGYFKKMNGERIKTHTYSSLAKGLVDGWMNSPGHRANILNSDYTHLGVGSYLHYWGFGIDRLPMVKSTQNFAKLNDPFIVARKTINSSYNQYSQSYSYTQPYKYENYKNEVVATKKKPSRIDIGVSVAGIFDSFEGLRSGKMDYQLSGQLGGYVGEKGHGRSFWGVFPSVDLTVGYPFALECGTVLSRFLKFSAGVRMLPNGKLNWLDYTIAPSATVGVQLHLSVLYISLDLNSFYIDEKLKNRYLASAGFSF